MFTSSATSIRPLFDGPFIYNLCFITTSYQIIVRGLPVFLSAPVLICWITLGSGKKVLRDGLTHYNSNKYGITPDLYPLAAPSAAVRRTGLKFVLTKTSILAGRPVTKSLLNKHAPFDFLSTNSASLEIRQFEPQRTRTKNVTNNSPLRKLKTKCRWDRSPT